MRTSRQTWPGHYRSGFTASPWELMRSMSEEIDRLIDGLSGTRAAPGYGLTPARTPRALSDYRGFGSTGAWTPQIEVVQKPNAFVLRADLPGLKPEEVDVSVEDGVLTISGERKQEHKEERDGFLRTERSYGQFYRAIPLPDGADEDKVSASFKNGVLEVGIPITARERGRKIKVEG
ncbi:MAG TPA: Hsp20/alpha crystallin family protein [Gemmatimonadaceae bacterium]|nr:Hsp20/alpha crystallin family protein [Gemmatimonadaceae bacterium]